MKFRLLVKLGELILKRDIPEDAPRADMYLPIWMLSFAVVLIVVGIAVGIYTIFKFSVVALVVAIVAVVLGIGALLCWKNQNIVILSGDLFEYTTFLGKKTTYRFSEIKGIRKNKDSYTLFVGNGKVHIESCAILSEELAKRINEQLNRIDFNA